MRKWFFIQKRSESKPHYHAEMKHDHHDKYQRDYDAVSKGLRDKPATWAQYEGDPHEYRNIIEMEIGEMNVAKARGIHHEYTESLIHVAAACLCAHHAMTCKDGE